MDASTNDHSAVGYAIRHCCFFVHVCNPIQVLLALKGSGLKHSTSNISLLTDITIQWTQLQHTVFTTLNSPFHSRDNTVRRQYSYFYLRLRKRSFYSILFILINNYFLIPRVKQVRPIGTPWLKVTYIPHAPNQAMLYRQKPSCIPLWAICWDTDCTCPLGQVWYSKSWLARSQMKDAHI